MASGSPHFRLRPIADGVHVAESIDGGFALSNGTILDLGGVTVVFDSMLTPTAGGDLARAAERLTGRRPDFLINSHYHGDHCRGNVAFAPVRVISSSATRALMRDRATRAIVDDRAEAKRELAALRGGRATTPERDRALFEGWYSGILSTPARLKVPLPDLLAEPELVLHGTRRSLRVLSVGGGHSPSDVVAFVPEDRIVVLGDLLSIGYHPWMADGNAAELLRILARVLRFRVDRAVPGHGPVGDAQDIRRLRSYVHGLARHARRIRRRGGRSVDPEDAEPPSPFDAWRFHDFYRENLAFVLRATPAG